MREGAVIGPIIVAIGLVVAAIALAVVGALLQTADGSTELRLERAEAETAQLRSQIDTLRTELRDVQAELDTLAEDVALAGNCSPLTNQLEIDFQALTGGGAIASARSTKTASEERFEKIS